MLNKYERVLLYGGSLWYLGEGMLGPLFAIFAERIGGDIFDITWAWATYLIVSGFLYVIFGKLSDSKKDGKRTLMVLGYALNAAFTFGYLFVATPAHLFIVQGGLGLSAALATPTWNALYDQHSNARARGLQWGLAGGWAQIITGIAIVIGGFIVSTFSFKVLFLIMGCIQLLATFYQAKILKLK